MEQLKRKPRSPKRVALYVVMTMIGFGAIGMFFYSGFGQSTLSSLGINESSNARDLFDGLYQIGWRSDGNAGNTVVEAVYYYPALYQALYLYKDRSSFQNETLQELNKYPDMSMYPVLVMLQRNTAIDQALSLDSHASLSGDSTAYEIDHWQSLTVADTSGNSIAGIVWFRRPSGAPTRPQTLTFTLEGIPGNSKSSTFSWNNGVLATVDLSENANR